jgi:hypothetical protein
VSAGSSAAREARLSSRRASQLFALGRAEVARATRYAAGAAGERRLAAQLVDLSRYGWVILEDRRWPGSERANIDFLAIGPGGILLIDAKNWAEPRVEGDVLYRGQADATDDFDKLHRACALVQEAVAPVGLAPVSIRPLMAFVGRHAVDLTVRGVRLLDADRVVPHLLALPIRLSDDDVRAVATELADACPAYKDDLAAPKVARLAPVLPRAEDDRGDTDPLFDVDLLIDELLEKQLDGPIEEWMTFLHPEQVRLVRRSWNGPARICGPAGTGKTVVGLHRAAYLTASRPGQVLYVSYVRTLPAVLSSLYARLSPETADRVEFTGLHRWALHLLRERGHQLRVDAERVEQLFARAWLAVGRRSVLESLPVNPQYWREEIDSVLKGRGITEYADYAQLVRVGRRTRLQAHHRQAVWELYRTYDGLLRAEGIHDFNDILALALTEIDAQPVEPSYSAVIVDEVQDLTCLGVRLLHRLVGDRPDGLLLIGDGQQAVYPGGFTLSEAGVAVAGRSHSLRRNYRNAANILELAETLVADDAYIDLDGTEESGRHDTDVARVGGETLRVDARDEASHDIALIKQLRSLVEERGIGAGDVAVLAPTRSGVRAARRLLHRSGFATVTLEEYDGRPINRVKVGTYKRAKGLEFKYVFLPWLQTRNPSHAVEANHADRERLELARRELYVAMTRARDGLWLGYVS